MKSEIKSLYQEPFKYDGCAYIYDAHNEMVADFAFGGPFRPRGWGRIKDAFGVR